MMQTLFEGVQPVSIYTRADAIADGFLIDVSTISKEAGFTCPVALTAAAWAECVKWDKEDTKRQVPQHEEGRLWDVVYMCYQTAKHAKVEHTFFFLVYRVPRGGRSKRARMTRLKAHTHHGDNGEQVVTIMQPDES
jgi:hypothetical protein